MTNSETAPLVLLVKKLRAEVEGPAGPCSFRSWNSPLRFEWLERPTWCLLCGRLVDGLSSEAHVCLQ